MKRNALAEVKKMDKKAVGQKAKDLKKELSDLLLDKNMNKIKNLRVLKLKRRDLAQTLTVLNQKNLIEVMEAQDAKE